MKIDKKNFHLIVWHKNRKPFENQSRSLLTKKWKCRWTCEEAIAEGEGQTWQWGNPIKNSYTSKRQIHFLTLNQTIRWLLQYSVDHIIPVFMTKNNKETQKTRPFYVSLHSCQTVISQSFLRISRWKGNYSKLICILLWRVRSGFLAKIELKNIRDLKIAFNSN